MKDEMKRYDMDAPNMKMNDKRLTFYSEEWKMKWEMKVFCLWELI